MSPPLSAVDSISPAFAQTKRLLFKPFRFGAWARLGVVAVITGEFAGGSWGGSTNINIPGQQGGRKWPGLALLDPPVWPQLREVLPWIALAIVAGLMFGFLMMYVASVYRFILLDAVLNSPQGLRAGWSRWRHCGRKFFWWNIGFALAAVAALALMVGAPIYFAWRAGWFQHPGQHVGLLVLGGVVLFFLLIGLVLLSAVVDLFARDFLVPVLALENCSVFDGWRRLLPMLRAEKGACAGYVLMKIVLAVGSAILFGIVNLIAIFLLLIPLGLVGAAAFGIWKAAALSWNPATVSAVVLLALGALGAIFWVVGFLYAPGLVFFQSYTLHFLGSRYAPLDLLLFPAPPAPELPPTPTSPIAPLPAT